MCGIAGMMTSDGRPPSPNVMQAMAEALAHRGPDGIGHYRLGDVAMMQRAKMELRGKVLGCWCSPKACHGDVLAEIANSMPQRGTDA